MVILELVAQGVRGFPPNARLALKHGYTGLLMASPSSTPAAVAGLTTALCFSDGRGGDVVFLAPGAKAGKAGLTLLGNDQVTYRLIRDLGGSGALHRLDKASGKFQVVTEDAAEASQYLRSQIGMPPKATFEQIFCFTANQFPTRAPKAAAGAGGAGAKKLAPAKPALAASHDAFASIDAPGAETKLRELEKELQLSREVDDLTFKIDGIASQLSELEDAMKGTEGIEAAIADAERAHANAPTPESLQLEPDIVTRLERYPLVLKKRDDALAKLEGERQQVVDNGAEAARQIEPLYKDVRFIVGMAIGSGFLALGAAMSSYAKYIALLDIPAFGLAALVALKWVDDLQGSTQVSRKGQFLSAREKKIVDEFEAEAGHVLAALEIARVETPDELIHLFGQKALLAAKVEDLKAQRQQLQKDPKFMSAAAQHRKLKAEQDKLNEKLLEKGGYLRTAFEVEKEIGRVKEAIAKGKNPQAAPAPAAVAQAAAEASAGEGFEDPTPRLLILGADLFTTDLPTLQGMVKERCNQYLSALTDRRYTGVEFDRNGKALAMGSGSGVAAERMAGADLDLLYLSLRLTLLERYSAKFKVPVLIDDALVVIAETKQPLVGRMLKHLGTLTQVVHVTANPATAGWVDTAVKLA